MLDQTLSSRASQRSFHSLYWPMIDTLAHIHGPLSAVGNSRACLLELEFIDLMLGHVVECCRRHDAALLITADHGQELLDKDRGVLLEPIAGALRHPPGGGRRALYLSSDDPAALIEMEPLSGSDVDCLFAADVIERGWFGGDCGRFRSRLGDVVALPPDNRQLLFDYGSGIHVQQGAHGGLSEAEMLVPLIAVPSAAW